MGDIGRLSADGTLELLDRVVDRAEGTESMLELEDEVLEQLPDLMEFVLLKDVGDDLILAVACPRDGGLDARRVSDAMARAGLAAVPLRIIPWESMPVTGSYKVRRQVLRGRLTAPDAGAPVMSEARS